MKSLVLGTILSAILPFSCHIGGGGSGAWANCRESAPSGVTVVKARDAGNGWVYCKGRASDLTFDICWARRISDHRLADIECWRV